MAETKVQTDRDERYELTTTLTFEGGDEHSRAHVGDFVAEYAERFDLVLGAILKGIPAVTAYFVQPKSESGEIEVGLRFEGMPAANIDKAASHIISEALTKSSAEPGPTAVREESTLVPA
jgi:hypothetical protein